MLESDEVATLVSKVTDAFHKARDEFGPNDDVTVLLDKASGLLDEAWDFLIEFERNQV